MMITDTDSGTAPQQAMPRGWDSGRPFTYTPEMAHSIDTHFHRMAFHLFGPGQGHAPTSSPPTEAGRAGLSWGLGVSRGVCHS